MTLVYLILALGFLAVFIFLLKLWQRLGKEKQIDPALLEQVNKRLDTFAESTGKALRETTESFSRGITLVEKDIKQMQEQVKSVSSFQDIFKSPKLRGRWGETSLEAVLAGYFPKELYSPQYYFKSGEAVDAVFRLPNNYLLPIDSKFNWENFEKMVNAEDEISRENFRKLFISDVKKKIDEISSKYILPPEGTTDFAFMYVPAEAVFYEVVQNIKEPDIADYARKKRVILVSPNTFFLSLSAVHHWYRDFNITKQTREIVGRLSRIKIDAEKLQDNFRKLGKHISDASSAYGESEKRLGLLTDRVVNIVEIGDKENQEENQEESQEVEKTGLL